MGNRFPIDTHADLLVNDNPYTIDGSKMTNLNEMLILISERVKIMLGPDELLKINKDEHLRLIVLEAAGNVTGILLDRMRNHSKTYIDLLDTKTSQELLTDRSKKIFEKALDESTISQVVNILKGEQKFLREQAKNRKYGTLHD